MKLLHTSDWHVGKAVRGRSRAVEHEAVLDEIVAIAEREDVDAVLVGGDLFDTATPAPESERIVYSALLRLAGGGRRPVVAIAGNHDNPHRLAAVAPVFAAHGVVVLDRPVGASEGGVVEREVGAGRELLRVAALPFPSKRAMVDAAFLMEHEAADRGAAYADRVRGVLALLGAAFDAGPPAVNVVLAHLMVFGGAMGGGERGAHTVFDYWVPATAFPIGAHYVGLGHLHRRQQLDGPVPVHYCGSPLQLDFGETANEPCVLVVEARPGVAGVDVRPVPLGAGRRLVTLRGTYDDLCLAAAPAGAHLRLVLEGAVRPGMADDLRERFPDAVEVVLAAREVEVGAGGGDEPARAGRAPEELVGEFLAEEGIDDPRLLRLFEDLLGEEVSS